MKNAILFHGSGETPDSFWYPRIKQFLEKKGYAVWAPQLPEPKIGVPELAVQLPFVLKNGKFDNETVIIGHSAGGPLALSVMESINVKIHKAFLVASYARPLEGIPESMPILQENYNWKKIKQNVNEIVCINSDNDPWKCNDKEGYYLFRHLGGTLIIRHGEGHMGSHKFDQPYKEFPLLEKLLSL